jgi:hypothetical protein
MLIASNKYQKNTLFSRLICISILLSLFIFLGYAGKSSFHFQPLVQTAWQYVISNTAEKNTVLYKTAAPGIHETYAVTAFTDYKIALTAYNNLIQVRLTGLNKAFNFAENLHHFIALQIVPENSDEDFPIQ